MNDLNKSIILEWVMILTLAAPFLYRLIFKKENVSWADFRQTKFLKVILTLIIILAVLYFIMFFTTLTINE